MDENVLRLEFGEGALGYGERRALFRVVDLLGEEAFGEINQITSFRNAIEIINVNGEYAKVSRQTIRNLGCVIGAVINVQYFNPTHEACFQEIIEYDDEFENDDEDESYIGRHISLSFDSTDGSFYKYDSLSRLYVDEEGDSEIVPVGSYCENDNMQDEAFDDLLEGEAITPTIDDYFIVNTVRLIVEKNLLS